MAIKSLTCNINYRMVQQHPSWLQRLRGCISPSPCYQSMSSMHQGCISTQQCWQVASVGPLNIHMITLNSMLTCSLLISSPVTRNCPRMLTPARWDISPRHESGRWAARVHAVEPRVQVSLEPRVHKSPLIIPPLTINTCTKNVTILWFI